MRALNRLLVAALSAALILTGTSPPAGASTSNHDVSDTVEQVTNPNGIFVVGFLRFFCPNEEPGDILVRVVQAVHQERAKAREKTSYVCSTTGRHSSQFQAPVIQGSFSPGPATVTLVVTTPSGKDQYQETVTVTVP